MRILDESLKIAKELFTDNYDPKHNTCWHYAFGYKRNKLLAIGQNNMKMCPDHISLKFARKFDTDTKFPNRHAEIDLISKMWGKIYIDSSIKIIVIRLNKYLELQNSRPCPRCLKIIQALGVTRIYHSTSDSNIIELET